MVYCTCGHLLIESESSQHFHQWRLDAFSIQNYVIKKGRPRGSRHGKTEAQKEDFVAHNALRRCLKKFEGNHGRFQPDSTYRDSQLIIGWIEEKCIAMDKLAQENHSHCPSSEEYEKFRTNWFISHWTNRARMHRWDSDLTSEQQSQLWTVSTENQEKNDLNPYLFINTKGGTRLLLPVLHGDSGMKTGGAHEKTKINKWSTSELVKEQQKERGDPYSRFQVLVCV